MTKRPGIATDFMTTAARLFQGKARARRKSDQVQDRRIVDAAISRLVAVAFPNVDHHWRAAAALKIRQTIAAHRVAWAEHHASETARRRAERRRNP